MEKPNTTAAGLHDDVKMNNVSSPAGPREAVPVEQLGFQVIEHCTYTPKPLGSSDQEALGCECSEEWGTQVPSLDPKR